MRKVTRDYPSTGQRRETEGENSLDEVLESVPLMLGPPEGRDEAEENLRHPRQSSAGKA